MGFLMKYIKQYGKGIIVFFLFSFIYMVTFAMFHLPVEAVLYPTILCGSIGLLSILIHMKKAYTKYDRLKKLQKVSVDLLDNLPKPDNLWEEEYQELVELLLEEQARVMTKTNARYEDMIDYYTTWAHQIKTPIASIRLHQQNEDSEFSRKVGEDLQRIEQYVEMVLAFLRLDSVSSDYIIREQQLDDIVKPALKKFSSQFIRRKIQLNYEPLQTTVITDEKWLGFVVEQILSNALKYTKEGAITITVEEPKTLCIKDTGIGIAASDLPRIFEKGYTGYNGRTDKKASGLGLYLCRRICNNLGHTITADSEINEGTTICIDLEQKKMVLE